MLRPLLALYPQGFLQVLDRLVERERYAAFGLGDLDSNLARGIKETVRRQERRLEDLKRRAENWKRV
jgi:hypothetical protein|tara:strand:- start:401 stop:601 length:201 start_codon:yes stop_codon:yes gene_type:complete